MTTIRDNDMTSIKKKRNAKKTTVNTMFYLNRANANCRSIDGRTDVPQVAERKLRTNSQLLRPRGAL